MIFRRFRKNESRKPLLPEGLRIYAIGDIHGRADLLESCFQKIDTDLIHRPAARPIQIAVGDYVDRGPDSKRVLDLLWERSQRHEMVMIRGNHEQALMDFLSDPSSLENWARIGGLETLLSYGLRPTLSPTRQQQKELSAGLRAAMPAQHLNLLSALVPSFSCGAYFFTHAGIRPGIPLSRQSEYDLMWIREEFLLYDDSFERIVVHGHTPVREVQILANRINIDTGAYATGRLSCIVFQPDKVEKLSADRPEL